MSDPQRTFSGPPRAADIYASVGEATTLAAVEKRLGFTTRGAEGAEAAWLEAVRQVPMNALADDDLAMLLSRGMHVPLLLPLALARLKACAEAQRAPLTDLIRGCGEAARLVAGRAPELTEQTRAALRALLSVSWGEQRVETLEAVYSALS